MILSYTGMVASKFLWSSFQSTSPIPSVSMMADPVSGGYLAHCEGLGEIAKFHSILVNMIYPLSVPPNEQAVVMSKNDVLKAIRQAESEASGILESANKEASAIVSAARSDASEIVAKGRANAEAEAQNLISNARKEAEKAAEKTRKAGDKDIDKLKAGGETNQKKAVDAVIGSFTE